MIIREERIGNQRLLLGDCLAVMPTLGRFDAMLVDPPYGIGDIMVGSGRFAGLCKRMGGEDGWDKEPPPKWVFENDFPTIAWGGNYLGLPPSRGWLAWVKSNATTTFTRRWHANPDMCQTIDPVSGHSARMGILALKLWPDASRDLLVACLCHDLGEHMTGDVAWPAKQDPELGAALDRIEEASLKAMGMYFALPQRDAKRLKYLDRLDAYLWTQHHRPDILDRDGWPQALAWLEREWAEVR